MISKGKIQQINRGMEGGFAVTLNLECEYGELLEIEKDTLSVELTKYRERRSLDANAYFHVLVAKIAKAMKRSNSAIKNKMIAEYGQYEVLDGRHITITTQIEPDKVAEDMYNHWRFHSCKAIDEKLFYNYVVMRGSHTYNTAEMSRLIEGTVYEAKELGIETLPPDLLERMVTEWQ